MAGLFGDGGEFDSERFFAGLGDAGDKLMALGTAGLPGGPRGGGNRVSDLRKARIAERGDTMTPLEEARMRSANAKAALDEAKFKRQQDFLASKGQGLAPTGGEQQGTGASFTLTPAEDAQIKQSSATYDDYITNRDMLLRKKMERALETGEWKPMTAADKKRYGIPSGKAGLFNPRTGEYKIMGDAAVEQEPTAGPDLSGNATAVDLEKRLGFPPSESDLTNYIAAMKQGGGEALKFVADAKKRKTDADEIDRKAAAEEKKAATAANKLTGEQAAKFAAIHNARKNLMTLGSGLVRYQTDTPIGEKVADQFFGYIGVDPSSLGLDRLGSGVNAPGQRARVAVQAGAEGYLRSLTGAAMPDSEVKKVAGQFVPGAFDNGQTSKEKMDHLMRQLETAAAAYVGGKQGAIDASTGAQVQGISDPNDPASAGPTVENAQRRPVPNQSAINALRANPEKAAEFDALFGPGSAATVMGQ